MKPITYPLRPNDKGENVVNLQDTLSLFIERKVIQLSDEERKAIETGLKKERSKKLYGETTARLVTQFRVQFKLNDKNDVDEPTAKKINELLKKLEEEQPYVVSGTVKTAEGKAAIGFTVKAFDHDFGGENFLGEDVTKADGSYSITFTESQFRISPNEIKGPDVFVRVFDENGNRIAQSKTINNASHETEITIQFGVDDVFCVKGQVTDSKGNVPATPVMVYAFDRDLRKEQFLGKTLTDAKGNYDIYYTRKQFTRSEKDSADLIVRVYEPEGEPDKHLFESPIKFDTLPIDVIDLELPQAAEELSEFERYTQTLLPLIAGQDVKITDLDDKDIDFLAGETGIERQHIAWLVESAKRHQEADSILPQVFYGLFRQNLPTSLSELLAQDIDKLRHALETSLRDHVIPLAPYSMVDEILAKLLARAAKRMLEPAQENERASFGDLVRTVIPKPAHQQVLADLFVRHRGTIEEFWKAVEERTDFSAEQVKQVQITLQLGTFTGNHLPLVHELQLMGQDDPTLQELRGFARLEEADWKEIIQKPQADGKIIGFPADTPGADDQEKIANYAGTLNQFIENTFPTAVIASRLDKDTKDDSPFKDLKVDFQTFFTKNPNFEFGVTPVDIYLSEDRDLKLEGIKKLDKLTAQLKSMQRIFKITSNYDQISMLVADGLHSMQAVIRFGKNRFVEEYNEILGGENQAEQAYFKAEQIHDMALMQYARHSVAFNSPLPYVIAGDQSEKMTLPERIPLSESMTVRSLILSNTPDWRTLFGSLDLCDCEHCQSVYSPAAYFVDILKSLNDGPTKNNKTPLQVLLERRADLEHIELTCKNTNTMMPYVDLVQEVLENAIAPPFTPFVIAPTATWDPEADLDHDNLSPELRSAFTDENMALLPSAVITVVEKGKHWLITDHSRLYTVIKNKLLTHSGRTITQIKVVSQDLQTSGTAAELSANPEHVNTGAYDRLANAVYPWNLPLNLWVEEARVYLNHMGVQRQEVMETVFKGTSISAMTDIAIAIEYLGLTSEEAKIIDPTTTVGPSVTTPNPSPWNFWGFSREDIDPIPDPADSSKTITGKWPEVLKRVDVFLKQSGLSYKELLELLGTSFVNSFKNDGTRMLSLVSTDASEPATCDLSKLKIEGLDAPTLSKIHRFVRLSRKLGWAMRDLDKAITALKPTDLNDGFLTQLSHIKRLCADLKIPLINMLSWWANIDTTSYIDHLAEGQPEVKSLYEQLFLNKAVINPVDEIFKLDEPKKDELEDTSKKINDHIPAVLAALKISAADLSLLTTDSAPVVTDDKLNLANLSLLYRVASFAKALKLSIHDYLSVRQLTDIDSFKAIPATATEPLIPATGAALLFAEKVGAIRASGFSINELDYLLRHEFIASSGIDPMEQAIALILNDLRGGLQKIAAENEFIDDPNNPNGVTADLNGDLTKMKLALLNWDNALIEQVVATLNDSVTYQTALSKFPKVSVDTQVVDFKVPTGLPTLVTLDAMNLKLSASQLLILEQRKKWLEAQQSKDTKDTLSMLFDTQDEIASLYDFAGLKLRFVGVMTVAKRNSLKRASDNQEYRDAVDALFNAPRDFIARNMRTFSIQDFSEHLVALPVMVTFPDALKSRVYYDAIAEKLHFIGAMTETERESLSSLSSDSNDPNHARYQAAVSKLFDAPDTLVPQPGDVFLTASGLNDDAAALFEKSTTPTARFELVLKKLMPYLCTTLSELSVKQKLGEALKLDSKTTEQLLTKWINSPNHPTQKCVADFLEPAFTKSNLNVNLTVAAFPDQFKTFTLLHKVAMLVSKFKITTDQLTWLCDYGPTNGWLNVNALPLAQTNLASGLFAGWERLVDLFRLRDQLPLGESVLSDVFSITRDSTTTQAAFLQKLSAHTGWNLDDLQFLAGAQGFGFTFPNAFKDERALLQLQACFKLMKRLGASADQLNKWGKLDQTTAEELDNARSIKNAAKAKYDDEQWLAVAKPLKDQLREKQRAAHVAYLVARDNMRDVSELYEYYLIDVEMSPCMMTTRIKQAICSVQLFIQRCLMNLETDVSLSPNEAQEWNEWRKQYRIWEANRKVFLYPENWIEPELRDDKSPFFKDLENELLQNDVTMDTAETAFLHYLEKLDQVARLQIIRQYNEWEAENKETKTPGINREHLFVRTFNIPHIYFYRKMEKSVWSSWERIGLDIEGDHVIPVVWNRRLLLFWLLFSEKAMVKDESWHPKLELVYKDGETPAKIWDIGIAWSELRGGKWLPKQIIPTRFLVKAGAMNWPPGQKYYMPPPREQNLVFQASGNSEKLELKIKYRTADFDDNSGDIKFLATTQQIQVSPGFKYSEVSINEEEPNSIWAPIWKFDNEVDKSEIYGLTSTLNSSGISGLLTLAEQKDSFESSSPYSLIDYSLYNWELFFHTPFLIATRLSKNQRFEEARKWFHYIFDPTASETGGPERFWKVKPFYELAMSPSKTLADLFTDATDLQNQAEAWRENPFKPHVVARLRHVAYMKTVVMKYIDNLIAWGDQLFRRNSIESINEATQLYVLAAQILGKRPEEIPPRAVAETQTFNSLNMNDSEGKPKLNDFGNALVEIENFIFPSAAPNTSASSGSSSLGTMSLFCLPKNDKLLSYWNTVADRLFKIRHCMNIEGAVRELPLFEPPIDPAMLVRAAAAGVDLSSALNDINAALPHYRFNVMLQKATELCNDVKALGGVLLSALEKRDAEALALLRSGHEIKLLDALREIKKNQIEETLLTLDGLKKYQDVVTARQQYYSSREFMNLFEIGQMVLTANAMIIMAGQFGAEMGAGVSHLIPEFKIGAPTTAGTTFGGSNIASASQAFGSALGTTASILNTLASMASTLGNYQRRDDDWKHQADLATKELMQVEKQIAAQEIRKAIAEKELQNHEIQIENAREVDDFMRNKLTNQELYNWMVGQISGIYFQSYQMAYDIAKRAERTYRYELGLTESNFIQFGYWDSLKKGLLAGEKLHYDLKRMEIAYLDQNKREYEITKHISLALLDPIALLKLKETGECFVDLPEALFDMDYPGHYMRRMKSVSITIPCVVGPYTGVNCTLTLLKNSVRRNPNTKGNDGDYARDANGEDPRFANNIGAIQSIATSSAQNDSGVFELNFRDERYLPFEGAGAISSWRIELSKEKDLRQFDYDTISDVILHVKYTAREGGDMLKTAAIAVLKTMLSEAVEAGMPLARIFSARHEFPSEWQLFLHPKETDEKQTLLFGLTPERFPFQFKTKTIEIRSMHLFLKLKEGIAYKDEDSLKFDLKREGATETFAQEFKVSGSLIIDLPYAKPFENSDKSLGNWLIEVNRATDSAQIPEKLRLKDKDGGEKNFFQLNPDAIEDIIIVVQYSVTEK